MTLMQSSEFDLVAKATFLLLAGWFAVALAHSQKAAVRHVLLSSTFGALLILPLIVFSAPELPVRVPMQRTAATPDAGEPRVMEAAVPAFAAAPRPTRTLPDATTVLRLVWLTGVVLLLAGLAIDLWRLRTLRRTALPARGFDVHIANAEIGRVELQLHEGIRSPLTCGLWHPAILLPVDARSWSDSDLRRALIHEAEHIRRADLAVQLLARVACAFYWFHPLAWTSWRRLRLEAERACDDAVLRHEEGADYAEQLVSLAERLPSRPLQAALGMAHRSDLGTRVSAILDSHQLRGRTSLSAALATAAAALLLVLAIGPIRAVAQSPGPLSKRVAAASDRALLEAAERGEMTEIVEFLNAGANANAALQGDGSPLIAAARQGHDEAVRLLLDRGADPNLGVEGDGNPLIMASRKGHLSTVRLLLDRGADIHRPVRGDGNALIMAARGGFVDVVGFLLDRGAQIEQVVPGDENALIEGSASGRLPVVKLLLDRGANANSRVWVEPSGDRPGEWRTPLIMARRNRHAEVVRLLESAGAHD